MAEKVQELEKQLTSKDIRNVFYRSNVFQGSWNFERMQALGYAYAMVPAIKRLYPEGSPERVAAIKRHLEFLIRILTSALQLSELHWRWKNNAQTALQLMMVPSTVSKLV